MQSIADILGRIPRRWSALDAFRLQPGLPGLPPAQPPVGPGRPKAGRQASASTPPVTGQACAARGTGGGDASSEVGQ